MRKLLFSMSVMAIALGFSCLARAAEDPPKPPAPTVTQAPPAPKTGTPPGLIQGTVILKRRTPVVGAAILIRPQDAPEPIAVTATDSKGAFKVDSVADGAHRIEITREAYKTIVKDNVVVHAPFRAVVEIVMEPGPQPVASAAPPAPAGSTIRLHGVALARDGGPKGEIRIRAARADGAEEPKTTLTGPDGTFALDGLGAGRWRLEVMGAGYIPMRVSLDLTSDSRMSATLVPQPVNYTPSPEDLLPPEEPIPPPAG